MTASLSLVGAMALQRLLLGVVLLVTMVTGEVLQEYNIGIMINRADTYLESYKLVI